MLTPRSGSSGESAGAALVQNLEALTHRIRCEYLEMPGLSLTVWVWQAARLWALDDTIAECVLETLIARRFLRRSRDGQYRRMSGH